MAVLKSNFPKTDPLWRLSYEEKRYLLSISSEIQACHHLIIKYEARKGNWKSLAITRIRLLPRAICGQMSNITLYLMAASSLQQGWTKLYSFLMHVSCEERIRAVLHPWFAYEHHDHNGHVRYALPKCGCIVAENWLSGMLCII